METIEIHVRPRWQARMVLLAMAFAVFAAWFAYDGAVACPAFNQRAALHNSLAVDQGRREEWLALAREKGWPAEFKPEEAAASGRVRLKGNLEIRVQIGLAAISLLVVLGLTLRVVLGRRKFIILDDEGLLIGEDDRVPLDRIVGIDMRRWDSQGVARIHYTDERGGRRHLSLNDWIHAGVAEIVERIEAQLPAADPAP